MAMKFGLRGITPVFHQITPDFHQVTPEFSPFKNAKKQENFASYCDVLCIYLKNIAHVNKDKFAHTTPRKLDKALGSSFHSCKVIK